MTLGRVILVLVLLVRPGDALAGDQTQPPALEGVSKLELWRAATTFRSALAQERAKTRGLEARLAARTSTVSAQVMVADLCPEALECPESSRLGDQQPWGLWILGGTAALALAFGLGLAAGLAAGH